MIRPTEVLRARVRRFVEDELDVDFDSDNITDDTDLFAERIVDSLKFVALVEFSESLAGSPLPLQDLEPASLATVNRIVGLIERLASEVP